MAKRLTIEPFPEDLKRRFKATAAHLGLTMSTAAQLAVGQWVREYQADPMEAEEIAEVMDADR